MKIFLKKYWTHIINLGLLIFLAYIFIFFSKDLYSQTLVTDSNLITILIIEGILIVAIWAEIIIYFIHAINNKNIKNNALCAVFCYLFNIFYIPCYCLKYVSKDKNYKTKNIIYLIISILIYFLTIFNIIFKLPVNVSYKEYLSPDNEIVFKLPNKYEKINNMGEYDIYFSNNYTKVGV